MTTTTTTTTTEADNKPKLITLDETECTIDVVTIFSNRAEIVRTVKATVESPGLYDVCVQNLSEYTVDDSVHVSGGLGDATVLEVMSKTEVKEDKEVPTNDEQKKETEEKLKELTKKQTDLAIQREVEQHTLGWLNRWAEKVRATPVAQAKSDAAFLTAPYIENIRGFSTFFAEETLKHSTRIAELEKQLEDVSCQIKAITAATHRSPARHVVRSTTAIVSLAVQKAGEVVFQLKYLVERASWKASYDCRVKSEGTLAVTYYGEIQNCTKEKWAHVRLVLSTASPSVHGDPGELSMATVELQPELQLMEECCQEEAACNDLRVMELAMPAGAAPMMAEKAMSVLTAVSSKAMASCTFAINRKATIASDNEPHRVTITVIPDITAKLSYVATPSATDRVFLKASALNTSDFPFLEGACNTFIDGNFVAASRFEYTAIGAPFKFFLGTDRELKLTYVQPFCVKDKAGIIVKSKVQRFTGSFTLRNGKGVAVNVTVLHPLPKSDNEEIKVVLAEPKVVASEATAVKINAKHMIRWKQRVEPGKTLALGIQYTVEHPFGRDIYFHS